MNIIYSVPNKTIVKKIYCAIPSLLWSIIVCRSLHRVQIPSRVGTNFQINEVI